MEKTFDLSQGRLIRGSVILDIFLINSWGGVGLYADRLIREYIRYVEIALVLTNVNAATSLFKKKQDPSSNIEGNLPPIEINFFSA